MKEDDIRRVLNWQADENEAAGDEEEAVYAAMRAVYARQAEASVVGGEAVLGAGYAEGAALIARAETEAKERSYAASVEHFYQGIRILEDLEVRHDAEIAAALTKLAMLYESWLGRYSGKIYEVLDQAFHILQDVALNTDPANEGAIRDCLAVYEHFDRQTEAAALRACLERLTGV